MTPLHEITQKARGACLNLFFLFWVGGLIYGGAAPLVNQTGYRIASKQKIVLSWQLPEIWFLRWRMFRYYSPLHRQSLFEVQGTDGKWIPLEIREIFRYRYDSGLRFERPDVGSSPWHQQNLLRYVCRSYEKRYPEKRLTRIRLGNRLWPKRAGTRDQTPRSPKEVKVKILNQLKCS